VFIVILFTDLLQIYVCDLLNFTPCFHLDIMYNVVICHLFQLDDDPLRRIDALADMLEMCQFQQFWVCELGLLVSAYFNVHMFLFKLLLIKLTFQTIVLSSIVKTRRLSLFGHIARMNESTDASRILFEPPSEVWMKPRGRPRNSWVQTVTNDLANSYTGLREAREAAQDRVYWRMFTKHSATHS